MSDYRFYKKIILPLWLLKTITSKFGDLNLKIVSFNVNGLLCVKSRRTLFRSFRKKGFDIICLQETHMTEQDKIIIEREWGPNFHLVAGTHKKKGLITLLGKRLQTCDFNVVKNTDRCLVSKLDIEGASYNIINVYAPCVPSEKMPFIERLYDFIYDILSDASTNSIVMGDFNIVLNNELDIISGDFHNEKIVNTFNSFVNELLLTDTWRVSNSNKKDFTYSKRSQSGLVARRLDFIFIQDQLLPFSKGVDIITLGFSDHRAALLSLDFSSFKRGPSNYKFNVSLLNDKDLVDDITSEINRIKGLGLDPFHCWEYIKASIKDLGRSYGRIKAREKRKDQKIIEHRLKDLEFHMSYYPGDEEVIKFYTELKQKLEIMNIREADGARIRSGIKWAEEGEKCTKYFLNLEKQRSNSNTIYSILGDNGVTYKSPDNVLTFIQQHFENIYKEDINVANNEHDVFINEFLINDEQIFINEDDELILNNILTSQELLSALKKSNNKSAPGTDGLPCEIYKMFWKDIKDPLLACYNYSYQQGSLCDSQKLGIICLHHKGKGLSRDIISNWRPISLTNFDYKLIAKCMAIRLNSCLSKLVDKDQYAFIKGRQVSDLLREIDDLLSYGKNNFPDSMILSLDYAKAFDSISLSAIRKALLYFGFNGTFIKWIDILLHDRKSCVRNGGYFSDYFNMQRGVRQGCPISPLLFILTLELLARDIRRNKNIKGIQLKNGINAVKIKLYADDATLFLKDFFDFREVLSRIKLFSKFSGLCLNKHKSAGLIIGNTNYKNRIKEGIKFYNKLKVLGIVFSNECSATDINENVDKKIDQLEKMCSLWGKRFLTFYGRITILKTFGLSLFIYIMQSIGISDEKLKRINTIMYRFIWNPRAEEGKKVTEKIRREIVNKSYENGGLNMIDIVKLQYSFLLKWGDKLLDTSQDKWKVIPLMVLKHVGGLLAFKSSVNSSEFKGLDLVESSFWARVLKIWLDYNKVGNNIPVQNTSYDDPIFNNTLIRFKRKVIFNKRCIMKSIIQVKDFIRLGRLMTFDEFNHRIGSSADALLVYNTLYNALLPHEATIAGFSLDSVVNIDPCAFYFRDLEAGKINRKHLYELIMDDKTESVKTEWRVNYNLDENDQRLWRMAYECCSETKLLELQFKILHNIFGTGYLRHKMRLIETNSCFFCMEIDTLFHFFVTCPVAKQVWEEADKLISVLSGRKTVLTERIKIFGIFESDSTYSVDLRLQINRILLVCKKVISKYKFEKEGNIKVLLENQLRFRGLIN